MTTDSNPSDEREHHGLEDKGNRRLEDGSSRAERTPESVTRLLDALIDSSRNAHTPDGAWHQYGPDPLLVSLDDYLRDAEDRFERDRAAYWRAKGAGEEDELAERVAEAVVLAALSLPAADVARLARSRDARVPISERGLAQWAANRWSPEQAQCAEAYARMADAERAQIDGFIGEHVQSMVGTFLLADVQEMATRCLEMARESLRNDTSAGTARYLARLSRCYITGLLPECVMLCRSVLESAVKEGFRRRGVPLPADSGGQTSMRRQLDAAYRLGFLSAQDRVDALDVWQRGNKAIHDDPTVVKDVFGTIQATMRVVRKLVLA